MPAETCKWTNDRSYDRCVLIIHSINSFDVNICSKPKYICELTQADIVSTSI